MGFNREYPQGRLSAEDDGETPVGIAADAEHKRVLINYFKPIVWIGLDFEAGLEFLKGLAAKLSEISDYQVTVTVLRKKEARYLENALADIVNE